MMKECCSHLWHTLQYAAYSLVMMYNKVMYIVASKPSVVPNSDVCLADESVFKSITVDKNIYYICCLSLRRRIHILMGCREAMSRIAFVKFCSR